MSVFLTFVIIISVVVQKMLKQEEMCKHDKNEKIDWI